MLEERLLSLADIAALERGFTLGAPTLAHAASALAHRWRRHLRDEETALRYAFLCWSSRVDPPWQTGLGDRLPTAESLLDEYGLERLSAESRFVVGWLAMRAPAALGDEGRWERTAEPLLEEAARCAPHALVIRHWRWFCGDPSTQAAVRDCRRALIAEIQARFAGRGALGARLLRELSLSVESALRRPRLV